MHTDHPFLDPAFSIRWSELTAGHVVPDMTRALEAGRAAIAAIEALPDGLETFANTFLALEKAEETVSLPWTKVRILDEVKDHPELRTAYKTILPKVTDFFSEIPLNPVLYRKLRQFREKPEYATLDSVEKRFVEETLKDFTDAGADQEPAVRDRLKAIQAALSEKTKLFGENELDSTNAYEKIIADRSELQGLPDSLIEAARLDALAKGHGTEAEPRYRLTLHAPSLVPALRFLDSDDLRRELYEALTRIGHYGEYENEPLIREILALRKEMADLLGREHFPDWVLSRRMAKTGATALAFVEDLHDKTRQAFDRENRELMEFKAKQTGSEPAPLYPWEFAYWSEKLRQDTYAFDEEALRPYFPLPRVMSGMFQLVERIFGIRVGEPAEKPETWHPDVRFYTVTDVETGRHLGSFYADWHPRDEKRSGAWMSDVRKGEPDSEGALSPHLGMICGNLMPPVGDKPALLNHREVETIFHEFGHLLHFVLSEVNIPALGGTSVAWDFVELPSQIMENWCWERESLDLFARHHETGEAIPEDLFERMLKARNFGAGRMQMRQLALGKMDLELHLNFNPSDDPDLDAFIDAVLEGYRPPTPIRVPSNIRSFGHLFSDPTGYAAGYYSYKWAEVLDADAFTRFAAEGILNRETGLAFRRSVLARGNSDEPEELFREFMGRDPDPQALLRRLDLVPA